MDLAPPPLDILVSEVDALTGASNGGMTEVEPLPEEPMDALPSLGIQHVANLNCSIKSFRLKPGSTLAASCEKCDRRTLYQPETFFLLFLFYFMQLASLMILNLDNILSI